jgi:hypothetical protein
MELEIGQRVQFADGRHPEKIGTIVKSKNCYGSVRVRWDGNKTIQSFHPHVLKLHGTDRFKYQPELLYFLYILLRDHVPFGVVEEIMEKQVEPTRDKPRDYSAGHMEEYAQSLIERLIR